MTVTIAHGDAPPGTRAAPPERLIRPSTTSWAAEYPFSSHWMGVTTAAGSTEWLHFIDEGPKDAPTVFFFHGNPTWSFYWRKLILGLRDKYRCVAIDHLGMGLSDRPQQDRYLLKDHVDRACALVDAIVGTTGEFSVVGHDWGGGIGAGVAGRNAARVKCIAWMNTAAFRSQEIPPSIASCRIPGFGAIAVRGFNAFAGTATFRAVEKHDRMTSTVKAGYLAPYGSWRDRIATLRFVEDIPLEASHPSWDELGRIEEGLARLKEKPVALFWGDKDWCFTPNFRKRFEREFPTAEVHAWQDCGHYVVEDAHERILPLLRTFFERHAGMPELSNPGLSTISGASRPNSPDSSDSRAEPRSLDPGRR